jgi:hypothetical protein
MDHASGSAFDIAPFNTAATSQSNEDWLDMPRGRIGFAWASNMPRGSHHADQIERVDHRSVRSPREFVE